MTLIPLFLLRWSRLHTATVLAMLWVVAHADGAFAAGPEDPGREPAATAAVTAPPAERPAGVDDAATYLPSLDGPIGLYHMSSADVGPVHHLRLALHGQYSSSSNLLTSADKDTFLGGTLTFGFTPIRYLEIFGGVLTSSNRNVRTSEVGRTDPEVIRAHGDLIVGPKLAVPVATGTSLGFEAGLRFLGSDSGLAFSPSATSAWLGPLATLDLRPLAGVPLRLHINASYYFDNSRKVYGDLTATPQSLQAAKFAYGVGASRVRLAAGIDAPLEKYTGPLPLRPFAEYHAELITANADPALAPVMPMDGPGPKDRQWLTFGVRAQVYRGFTLDGGADIRLRSNGLVYEPPLPPYTVLFGASYPLDVDAFTRPVIVTRVVEKPIPAPLPAEGRIAGVAKDKDGKGVARAIVSVAGRPHGGVVTDADGSFEIASLAPGPATVEVSSPDFNAEKLTTAITAGRVTEVSIALTPKIHTGQVRGKTVDAQGHAVEATLKFSGAQSLETRTDGGGLYQAALLPGPYRVVAEAPGLPAKERQFEVVADGNRQVDLTLRPISPDLTLTADEIVLRAPIKFKSGAPQLTAQCQAELDGVAAVLEDQPDIRTLRIEAHWDPSAGTKAKDLTQTQANAVRDYLIKRGIADARLEAVGMGSDQPLVPNVTPAYKAKNRRVELHPVH